MTDAAALGSWVSSLGLTVTSGADGSLTVTGGGGAPGVAVRSRAAGTWEIVHERRLSADTVRQAWLEPGDAREPSVTIAKIVEHIANASPLVSGEVTVGDEIGIRLSAPVFDEGLTKQAFLLTFSSLWKAAEAFDLATEARVAELAGLADFRARSAEISRAHTEELAKITASLEVSGPAATPGAGPATCPSCGRTPAAGTKFCNHCGTALNR